MTSEQLARKRYKDKRSLVKCVLSCSMIYHLILRPPQELNVFTDHAPPRGIIKTLPSCSQEPASELLTAPAIYSAIFRSGGMDRIGANFDQHTKFTDLDEDGTDRDAIDQDNAGVDEDGACVDVH